MSIPVGFQLHITTWENDADHYNTEIISGLTENDVRFLIDVASAFKSQNNHDAPGLGNGTVAGDQLQELIREKLFSHPNISDKLKREWSEVKDDEDYAYSILVDSLLGSPQEDYDMNFCRVFDSAQVFYFPEEVLDVTEDFWK